MKPLSQSRSRSRTRRPGFLAALAGLLDDAAWPTVPRRRGRRPQIPLRHVLAALIFHVMQDAGTLREHFAELFGRPLADSSWSDRRTRLPWRVFAELMARMLKPRATRAQADAFWRGWRLLALDGTQFSLPNTAPIRATTTKARSRRGAAAFAKLGTAVVVELGLHNPIAAAIGRAAESEWALALTVLPQIPAGALLLADRWYGCAAFLTHAVAACTAVGSHLLVRARRNISVTPQARLRDGSQRVRLPVYHPDHPRRIVAWLDLREIRVLVRRPGHGAHEVRLWTTLLDPHEAPALDLAALYARRWEHELYFREVKHHLRRTDLLQSHTVETAAQEVAAIVIASALLAVERAAAAGDAVPVLRVSVAKVLRVVQALWLTIELGDDLLTDHQIQQIMRRGQRQLRACLTAPTRSRSCPRKIRQPVTKWPRLIRNESIEGPVHFTVL
jgi:hypothetical protein